MKVNEVFKLPLHLDSDVVRDNNNDYIVNMDTTQEDEAVVIAINHHDELVSLLTDLDLFLCEDKDYIESPICMKINDLLTKIEGK